MDDSFLFSERRFIKPYDPIYIHSIFYLFFLILSIVLGKYSAETSDKSRQSLQTCFVHFKQIAHLELWLYIRKSMEREIQGIGRYEFHMNIFKFK